MAEGERGNFVTSNEEVCKIEYWENPRVSTNEQRAAFEGEEVAML